MDWYTELGVLEKEVRAMFERARVGIFVMWTQKGILKIQNATGSKQEPFSLFFFKYAFPIVPHSLFNHFLSISGFFQLWEYFHFYNTDAA